MIRSSGQFLAGRFVLGFGVSFCCVSAPTYVSLMNCILFSGTCQLTCRVLRSLRWHTQHGEEPSLASTTALGTLVCLPYSLAHPLTPGLITTHRLNHSFLGYLWMRLHRWRRGHQCLAPAHLASDVSLFGESSSSRDSFPGTDIFIYRVTSGIVCVGVFFIPESPRWLMANDKHEEAARVLAKYHGEGSIDHPIVQLQLKEMVSQISTDASDKSWYDYSELWSTHSARRRLICVLGMAFFGQISGNSLSSYYLVISSSLPFHNFYMANITMLDRCIEERRHHRRETCFGIECDQPHSVLFRISRRSSYDGCCRSPTPADLLHHLLLVLLRNHHWNLEIGNG